jgi:hypothetical protein
MKSIVNADIELVKQAKEKLKEASKAEYSDKWMHYTTIQKKIKVHIKTVNNGCGCVCGTGIINATPEQILNVIHNDKNWKKIDPLIKETEYINLSNNQRIIHLMFNEMYLISSRDVVYMETIFKEPDGTIMIVSNQTNMENNLYAKKDNYVRAELKSGGWYLTPFNNKCIVTYYNYTDFKFDNITSTIMNLIISKIPNIILKIEELIS